MSSNSGWKTFILEEVLEILIDYRGKTPKKTDTGIPLITAKIVKNGAILPPNEFIDEKDYDSWMVRGLPKVGDVVLTTEAPLGEVAQLSNSNVALAQRIVTLRGKANVLDNGFLKYYLMSNIGQSRLKERESGTTVTGIKQSELRLVQINMPDYETQIGISKILHSIENKLELNNAINNNLEEMALALFKRWFVDFEFPNENGEPYKSSGGEFEESEMGLIPNGWKLGSIGDIATHRKDTIKPEDIPNGTVYVGLEHVPRKKLALDSFGISDNLESNKTCFKNGDVLFGKLRPYFHKVSVAPFSGVCSTDIIALNATEETYYGYLVSHLFSERLVDYVTQCSNGTKMPRTNWNDISRYKIVIPTAKVTSDFTGIFKGIVNKMQTNFFENQQLTQIRDTLLPKLMSGELQVPKDNKFSLDQMLDRSLVAEGKAQYTTT
ncbi:restriction endonuclease subunit S [Cohnella lubricantis]|uniref:Restriction endonuclease subunit S n=1 Tax=Cohnella lubricantis TaxID=2163172 RepID=A0A841TGM2_9BACL|nr:restriction endonuclease subunit S [Cohnella lubricantis]MBB6678097.1 restriction endonuclease subunit S [Cohnella lubricantis]MBP2120459.1 type I restriction enzyme S subunit [Cohnella lubricantis]